MAQAVGSWGAQTNSVLFTISQPFLDYNLQNWITERKAKIIVPMGKRREGKKEASSRGHFYSGVTGISASLWWDPPGTDKLARTIQIIPS